MIDYEPKSYWSILLRTRGTVIPQITPRILLCAAIGGAAAFLYFRTGFKLPPVAHTMLGLAIGLLLVFRTTVSYDRYWEGRRLLGNIVNRSRDVLRQATTFLEGDGPEAALDRREAQRLVVLFYALVRQYLRGERRLEDLGVPITDAERDALAGAAVRPNLAALWLTRVFDRSARAGRLSEARLRMLDLNMTALVDLWGGAERIMRTPVPFAYAHHIRAFLALFCLTSPFAMVEAMKWYTPIAAAALAFGMFGIDEIGVEIEDPFGYDENDLPLDAIGISISEDTELLLARSKAA